MQGILCLCVVENKEFEAGSHHVVSIDVHVFVLSLATEQKAINARPGAQDCQLLPSLPRLPGFRCTFIT